MMSPESPQSKKLPEFVALFGMKGSGKDHLGRYLAAEYGYLHVPASDALRRIAREKGYEGPIQRELLSKIGDEFKREFGPSPITESSIGRYLQGQENYNGLVISGLRRPPEAEEFKRRGAFGIWICMDESQRFNNTHRRDRGDRELFEEFRSNDRLEYEGPAEANSDSICLKIIKGLADYEITNDNTDKFLSDAVAILQRHQK